MEALQTKQSSNPILEFTVALTRVGCSGQSDAEEGSLHEAQEHSETFTFYVELFENEGLLSIPVQNCLHLARDEDNRFEGQRLTSLEEKYLAVHLSGEEHKSIPLLQLEPRCSDNMEVDIEISEKVDFKTSSDRDPRSVTLSRNKYSHNLLGLPQQHVEEMVVRSREVYAKYRDSSEESSDPKDSKRSYFVRINAAAAVFVQLGAKLYFHLDGSCDDEFFPSVSAADGAKEKAAALKVIVGRVVPTLSSSGSGDFECFDRMSAIAKQIKFGVLKNVELEVQSVRILRNETTLETLE